MMKKLIPSYVRVPLIFAIVLGGLEFFIDSGDRPAFIKFPMVALFLVIVVMLGDSLNSERILNRSCVSFFFDPVVAAFF